MEPTHPMPKRKRRTSTNAQLDACRAALAETQQRNHMVIAEMYREGEDALAREKKEHDATRRAMWLGWLCAALGFLTALVVFGRH